MSTASSFLLSTAPLRIVVAAPVVAATYAHALVQQRACQRKKDGDVAWYAACNCSPCVLVRQHAWHELWWLEPEKAYGVQDVEPVLQRAALRLDPGQHSTVVFARANQLSVVVANSLLKLFEEPPQGYQFVLLTDDLDALLPTIRSRAQIFYADNPDENATTLPPLVAYFVQKQMPDAQAFEAVLKAAHPNEQQSVHYASQLLAALVKQLRRGRQAGMHSDWEQQAAEIVQAALRMPPPAGGSEFFWKLLYLEYPWHS